MAFEPLPIQQTRRPTSSFSPLFDEDEKVGAGKAFVKAATFQAAPTTGAIASGVAGAKAGAIAGTAFGPVGTAVGGVVGAVGGGILGAVITSKAQEKALEIVNGKDWVAKQQAELAKNRKDRPLATFAGEVAPSLLTLKPSPQTVVRAAKFAQQVLTNPKSVAALLKTPAGQAQLDDLINVSVGGASELGTEAYTQAKEGDFNAVRLIAAGTVGTLINQPNRFGMKIGMKPSGEMDVTPDTPKPTTSFEPIDVEPRPADAIIRPQEAPQQAARAVDDSLTLEARKYKTAEEFVNSQAIKEGISTRFGKIDKNGAYFSTAENGTNKNYFNQPTSELYDTSSAKIVKSDTPEALQVLKEAVKDPNNTSQQLNILRRELNNPDNTYSAVIDWHLADEIPSVVKAAKKLGYDGIRVIETGDVSKPSSQFIWNTEKVKPLPSKSQLTDIWKRANIDERLVPLADKDGMVTVYRASAKFPKEKLPKDTFVATDPNNARYYAESHYKGEPSDITIRSFKVPASELKRGGSADAWQLKNDFLLTDIWERANKGETPGATRSPEGERFASRVYERMREENPDIFTENVEVAKVNLKKDYDKAIDLVLSDKQKAFRVAMGAESSSDVLDTNVNIALVEKALDDGNNALAGQLVKNRSLAQTRRGQEIVAERGSISDNSTSKYVKELIASRLDKLGDDYLTNLKEVGRTRKSKKGRGLEAIDAQVKDAQAKVAKVRELDLREAQSIIDKLTC